MFLIGVIISFLLMKFSKKFACLATLISTFMAMNQLNSVYNNNLTLYAQSTITSGIILGFLTYFFFSMFVFRLFGLKPKFKEFYIKNAKVVNKGATNFSGSTTKITAGTFGGLNADTKNYNFNVDTLFVQMESGKILGLDGIGKNNLATIDDNIKLAGFGSIPETVFYNKSKGNIFTTKIYSPLTVLCNSFLYSVPLLGHLILIGSLFTGFNTRTGTVSEKTNEHDLLNLFFALTYITFTFFVCGVQFVHALNKSSLIVEYIIITLPVIALQFQLMRNDHVRWQKFLVEQIQK